LNRPLLLLSLAFLGANRLTAAESADLARARSLFEAHRFTEARPIFERISATNPQNADVHYYLGDLALERADVATAVRELERAVALEPASARDHNALGFAYGESAERAGLFGKFDLARKCVAEFERAVALDPNNVDFHESLLRYYSRAPSFLGGGPGKANAEAATIQRLDPKRGHQAFAILLFDEGKYDPALAELDKVLESSPRDYATLYQVGRMAAISGQHLDRGLESLQLCLKLDAPRDAASHATVQWRMGNILEKKGDLAGARAAYRVALRLDPEFTAASEALKKIQ